MLHNNLMSNSCAQAYTVQEPMKPWKGLRLNHANSDQNPVTSHDFQWCSTGLSPDPSTFDTTSPRRSASLYPPDLHSTVANLVVAEGKFFDGFVNAQGIGQDLEEMESRASSGWHVAKQKPQIIVSEGIPPTLKVKRLDWSQEAFFS